MTDLKVSFMYNTTPPPLVTLRSTRYILNPSIDSYSISNFCMCPGFRHCYDIILIDLYQVSQFVDFLYQTVSVSVKTLDVTCIVQDTASH